MKLNKMLLKYYRSSYLIRYIPENSMSLDTDVHIIEIATLFL
jgi:hypothetical protein